MKNKFVDLSKISTIAKIDCLEFNRHQKIVRTSSNYRMDDTDDYLLKYYILRNCWGKKREFIWVDYPLGIVRDRHHNYFMVSRLKRLTNRDANRQLSLFGDD
jgi:hypothetical protein